MNTIIPEEHATWEEKAAKDNVLNTNPAERNDVKESDKEEQKELETIRNSGDTKQRNECIYDWGNRREIKMYFLLERIFPKIYFGFKFKSWNKKNNKNINRKWK